MPADVAQEVDVIETGEPVGVVEHRGVGRPVAEGQEALENAPDRRLVGVNLFDRQKLAAFVLARRIADACGAAAHERQGFAAGALQPGEQHDRQERADMKRRGRAVEADIGGESAGRRLFVQPLEIGALMHEAALQKNAQKVGFGGECVGHRAG